MVDKEIELQNELKKLTDIFSKKMSLDKMINQVFNYIIEITDVDHIFLNVFNSELNRLKRTHECAKPGVPNYIEHFKDVSVIVNENVMNDFKQHGVFIYNNEQTVAPSSIERLKSLNIKAMLLFPVLINNVIVGSIGISYSRKKKQFKPSLFKLIKIVSYHISELFEKQYNEIKLNINSELYKQIFQNFIHPIVILNKDYKIVDINSYFEKKFNNLIYEVLYKNFFDIIVINEKEKLIEVIEQEGNNHCKHQVELLKIINGVKRIYRLCPFKIKGKESHYIVIIFQDITEEKIKTRNLEQLAYLDQQTGLCNRSYYKQICDKLEDLDYTTIGVTVIYLNRFKKVCDEHGYESSDQLLHAFIQILQRIFMRAYLNARIETNKFIIFQLNKSEDFIKMLIHELERDIEVYNQSHDIKLFISIGFVYSNTTEQSVKEIVEIAESKVACKHNK